MTRQELQQSLYGAVAKCVVLAVALVLLWGFLHTILEVVLLFLLASIIAIALTPAVNWLESKKIARSWATVLALIVIFLVVGGLISIVWPKLGAEINHLARDLPSYGKRINDRFRQSLSAYPQLERQVNSFDLADHFSPAAGEILSKLGLISKSFIALIIGSLVLITTTGYMLAFPRPLLRGLMQAVPEEYRERFSRGLVKGSDMIVRWVWANAIIGIVDGILATIVLSVIGVPAAFVWGLVTAFSELIPQLGAYLMAIPPTIVALATDPVMALEVVVFYILLQQLVNHFLAPMIRARTMKIHPVSEIFTVLSLTLTYGLIGAVIADPVLGFVKAFYDAFYGETHDDPALDAKVEDLLQRKC